MKNSLTLLCALGILGARLESAPLAQVQTRPDGVWLVYSNTPAHWTLQRTTNLVDWHPMLEGWTNVASVEVRLQSGLEMIFYRLEALP